MCMPPILQNKTWREEIVENTIQDEDTQALLELDIPGTISPVVSATMGPRQVLHVDSTM